MMLDVSFFASIEKHSKHITEAISIVTDQELMNEVSECQIAQDQVTLLG